MAKNFRYTGAQDLNETIRVDGKKIDLRLTKGQEIVLNETNPHIKALISTGKLVEVNNISK